MILAAALVTALAAGSLVGAARAHIDDNAPTCGNFATGDFFDADTLRALFDVDTMIDAWPGQCKRIAMYQDTGFWWCNDNPTEFAWATGTEALDALDTLLDSCCLNSAQGSTGAISGQLFSQGDQTNFILAYTDSTYGPDVPPDQYPQGLTHGQCV